MNGTAISWATRKQTRVALSTCEAEYMALCEATKETLYINKLVKELQLEVALPLKIQIDNQSAMKIASNPAFHRRTKHISRDYNFVRDEVRNNRVELAYVPTEANLADVFTKPMSGARFRRFRERLISLRGSVER